MAISTPTLRQQNWGDDVRLPTFMNADDTAALLAAVDPIRKPPVPLQSKHLTALKRNIWFALRRPVDRSRSGLLCLWPRDRLCVYISGEPVNPKRPTPRVAVLRLRVDTQFYDTAAGGMTVFSATLVAGARKLQIEDVLMWKGRNVWAEEGFEARWLLATQWLEHYCIVEPRLIGGLDVEIAPWSALETVSPEGVWELMGDQPAQRRLLWIANHGEPMRPVVAAHLVPAPVATASLPPPTGGTLVAVATRDTTGPDQWNLSSADGVALGRALIRKLRISAELREVKGTITHVHVVWATTFNKWEITELCEEPSTHSSFFNATK